MIVLAIATIGLLVGLIVYTHQSHQMAMAACAEERAKLLDRIQHPERLAVPAGEMIEYDPPKDTTELAYIGQIVPEFIQVGGTGGNDA